MRAYRILAFITAALVAVQAAAIGYGVFAMFNWIDSGGTLDQATANSGYPGRTALYFHAFFGAAVLLAVLALLVVSFFAKSVPQGRRWALYVLIATVIQILLGVFSHVASFLGGVHGAWAIVLAGVAASAGARAGRVAKPVAPAATVSQF